MTDQPPPSVGKLEKYVLAYAKANGTAVGRVRHWISFMILGGALDRAAVKPGGPRFIVKGGVALELRIRDRSRATRDLDVVAVRAENLLGALDEALREPYHDFAFTRQEGTWPLGDHGIRVSVQIAYRSQRWSTVQLDLVRPDGSDVEAERVPGIPLEPFGLIGPADVSCLSLRYHIAQKSSMA